MTFIIGFLTVMGCVLGGFAAMGGHLSVLWQPFEFVIILGAALGAFIIGNPSYVLKAVGPSLGTVMKGPAFTKADYIDLLTMLYQTFKLVKSKGMLELEKHIEEPHESSLFSTFPKFLHHEEAVIFFCDYMRMITMGAENVHQIEDLMAEEIEIHHKDRHKISSAIQVIADGTPALGIVAAVLGVIKTMGAINQPPEILGHYIGGALVGTFLGVLVSYGVVGPIAQILQTLYDSEAKYLECIKAGLISYMNGYAPAIVVEFARKSIDPECRPTFYELDEAINNSQGPVG